MDVRCEKCQTEYELDESRLKPGGVTVKCTNCGHMFKIRKRANTNVGAAAPQAAPPPVAAPPAAAPPKQAHAESAAGAPSAIADMPSGPMSAGADRQWMVRLENGETKSCKELATLQQWIVAGVVSRESLISRSGKTWKRLGDIPELAQYFHIADEAKASRAVKPTGKTGGPVGAGTMLGLGTVPAGKPARPPTGDEDLEGRTTGNFRVRPPTPPPPPPAAASVAAPAPPPKADPIAQTELAPSGRAIAAAAASAAPIHDRATEAPANKPKLSPPADRQTAAWAASEIKASESMAAMPQGPRAGKLSASPDDKAYGGRVRLQQSEPGFKAGNVRTDDDDDALYPARRGSRVGMWIALVSLLVIGAAAGAVYMFVFNKPQEPVATATPGDAAVEPTADGGAVVVTPIDGGVETPAVNPLDSARAELLAGVNARMKSTLDGLAGMDDPESLAMRARLATALAQSMQDRALFVDKAEADKLRKAAKQTVLDSAPLAQRAVKDQADSASANLAMADIMRLQAKPAPSVKRYIETARTKAAGDKELLASVALAEAQLAIRDGKLPDADKALAGIDAPDDMRIKQALAQLRYAQNKPAEAKAQVDQILATQPDHDVALAMYKKLETVVSSSDPLPPEDNGGTTTPPTNTGNTNTGNTGGGGGGGGDYDSVLAKANKLAETNCSKAMDLFAKALEQKPNGVEALTGMGYCHLDAKQFSSAFSKFRAALAVSSKYEPALGGIAETYQRQGNKDAAIEAWRKYLDVYPSSPKAKKQLEILGASADGGGTGGGTTPTPTPTPDKKPEETPPPTPTPAPAPTPAPEAGSASN